MCVICDKVVDSAYDAPCVCGDCVPAARDMMQSVEKFFQFDAAWKFTVNLLREPVEAE